MGGLEVLLNWVDVFIYLGIMALAITIILSVVTIAREEIIPVVMKRQADTKWMISLALGIAITVAVIAFLPALIMSAVVQSWRNIEPYTVELRNEIITEVRAIIGGVSTGVDTTLDVRYEDEGSFSLYGEPEQAPMRPEEFPTAGYPIGTPTPNPDVNVGGGLPIEDENGALYPNVTVVVPEVTPEVTPGWRVGDSPPVP